MATVDPNRGWWGEQCPGRGPGLAHGHASDCQEPVHAGKCCTCGHNEASARRERDMALREAAVPPPISVNDRLRDLGLLPQKGATLSDDERRRLETYVIGVERKRGYR